MSASGSHQGSGGSRTELVGRHKSSWVAAEVPRFRLRGTQALVSAGCREMAGKGGRDWSLESRLRSPAWGLVIAVEKTSLPECRFRAPPPGHGAQWLPQNSIREKMLEMGAGG